MSSPVMTPTMQAALDAIRAAGGTLERRSGGVWLAPGAKRPAPEHCIVTQTLMALENRGAVCIEWTAKPVRAVMKDSKPHITETEAYWRAEAATARHIAAADRRRPTGSIESIRMSEAHAAECDQRADAIAKKAAQ